MVVGVMQEGGHINSKGLTVWRNGNMLRERIFLHEEKERKKRMSVSEVSE